MRMKNHRFKIEWFKEMMKSLNSFNCEFQNYPSSLWQKYFARQHLLSNLILRNPPLQKSTHLYINYVFHKRC